MGQCLSCCDDDQHPTQNGHTVSSPAAKALVPDSLETAPMTKYRPQALPMPVSSPGQAELGVEFGTGGLPASDMGSRSSIGSGHETDPLYVTRVGVNGADKKLFSQYPKLPPIRKPSGPDSKRTSFSSNLSLTREVSETKINALFEQYKDPDEDCILADGIEKLCSDLEVRPEEFRVLVLAWKFDAETMCRFSRTEFVNGLKKLRVDSIRGVQSRFPDMIEEVQNKQAFRDLYKWTYKFGLDSDLGQRTLPADMAISLWQLVFSCRNFPMLDRWLNFLENHSEIRGIPKDTWDMFLNFLEAIGDDLSTYDDTEAWPSLFDDFVEWENDRQNQNVKLDKPSQGFC